MRFLLCKLYDSVAFASRMHNLIAMFAVYVALDVGLLYRARFVASPYTRAF